MYKLGITDGIIRSIESYYHIPDYKPQEGEIFCENEIPVPSVPVYDGQGNVIDATPANRNIPYAISKNPIATNESTIITTTPGIIFEVESQEYVDEDGIIEYSNENVGIHQIILKGYDYFLDTVIEVEVVE